ncbi:ring-infected erythrocyte surface antigen-like, partial [Hibiscus syriacus]|uniref:ring-infected erythrocyte surface antigen-like n=1 Tax=Hibiscus syriacus TaxID=106335 RepID=UPI001920B81F
DTQVVEENDVNSHSQELNGTNVDGENVEQEENVDGVVNKENANISHNSEQNMDHNSDHTNRNVKQNESVYVDIYDLRKWDSLEQGRDRADAYCATAQGPTKIGPQNIANVEQEEIVDGVVNKENANISHYSEQNMDHNSDHTNRNVEQNESVYVDIYDPRKWDSLSLN